MIDVLIKLLDPTHTGTEITMSLQASDMTIRHLRGSNLLLCSPNAVVQYDISATCSEIISGREQREGKRGKVHSP